MYKCIYIIYTYNIYIYIIYIYIYIYVLLVFNKSDNSWPLDCISWINSNLQMATIYLVFLKNKNIYIKITIKLFVK